MNIFFPKICVLCLANSPGEEVGACMECSNTIIPIYSPQCPGCGGVLDGVLDYCNNCLDAERSWKNAYSLFEFKDTVRKIILSLKYKGNVAAAKFLATSLYLKYKTVVNPKTYQAIVPVPLHWFKQLTRGYNQTELVAYELGRLSGIQCKNLLIRSKWTPPQTRLNRRQRMTNLNNAFKVKNIHKEEFSSILLLDDVFTTGSTMEACSKVLVSNGIKTVDIMTIAHG